MQRLIKKRLGRREMGRFANEEKVTVAILVNFFKVLMKENGKENQLTSYMSFKGSRPN